MKKQITIHLDDEILALIDNELKSHNISSRSNFINGILHQYYKQKLRSDNLFLDTNEEQLLNEISRSLSKIQKLILYSNHLLNGGLPIFKTNTETLILKPTENLRNEARKKTAISYANFLKNEMSKEDYYSKGSDENDG